MPESKEREFLLGGQAVIEGVMMRSPNYYTVAVRKGDGSVVVKQQHRPRISDKIKWLGWPFIRGVATLGQTLSIGIGALNFSAEVAMEEENQEQGKAEGSSELGGWKMFLTVMVALLFAFGLVVLAPLALTDLTVLLVPTLNNPLAYNTIDGLFRIFFFLGYISLISLMKDIRRVFQYHGAEHMSVYASENEAEISVDTAEKYSPYHPRCGTSFLLLVMLVAIAVFSFTPINEVFWLKLLIRTPLIPVIAGVSYEVLRLTAKLSTHGLFSVLSAPGMWLQRLTAKFPDKDQLEIGVIALNQVIKLESTYNGGPLPAEQELVVLPSET